MIHKGIYRHFKGGIYEVVGVAIHTETQDGLVLYKDVNNPHNIIWARPVSMWNDPVNGKPRFQLITDEINVGDEVNWLGDYFIVTRIFQPRNMKEQCDGIDDDGCVYHDVLIKDLEKTGRHFDIKSILEAMKHD